MPETASSRRPSWVIAAAIVVLATGLHLEIPTDRPLWSDEYSVATLVHTATDAGDLVRRVAEYDSDTNPPLHPAILTPT